MTLFFWQPSTNFAFSVNIVYTVINFDCFVENKYYYYYVHNTNFKAESNKEGILLYGKPYFSTPKIRMYVAGRVGNISSG